jgi:hypothetical protein
MYNVITVVIALVSVGFTAATYFHQQGIDDAAAAATVRHDASQVTYWIQGAPNSSTPQLVIDNKSGGPIRGLTLQFPQSGQSGGWEAFSYYSLPDIPPCSMETTSPTREFISPPIGQTALNGSILDFTDQNGNSWALKGGYGQLIALAGYKQQVGFSWGSGTTFKPAQDCS